MQVLIIGYGKMGKAIEGVLLEEGFPKPFILDEGGKSVAYYHKQGAQVAIEFTSPEAAPGNITACLECGLPVVSGSTGWLDKFPEITKNCQERNGSFFYASNFSVGVNIVFYLNKKLANLMHQFPEYLPAISETHHTEKKDKPSGTAITLAQGIVKAGGYESWHLKENSETPAASIPITALREAGVPGTHQVYWSSKIDTIGLQHQAHSRQGFATGAVMAAKWILDKKGTFGMEDLLQL